MPEAEAVQGQPWEGPAGCPFFRSLFQVPTCPGAPRLLWAGADLGELMAPGMGLGAAGAGHYLGSPFLSVLLCGCADELLSENLTSAVRIHCV